MVAWLKASTAVTVILGPFLDKTDGVTEETGAALTVQLSKNGAAFLARDSGDAITEDTLGWYFVPLSTADTGAVGPLTIRCHANGTFLPVWREFMVVAALVYDSIVAGSDYLQADAMQVEGVDATNQIRDAVVDDATRIDASALNTLSAKAPSKAYLTGSANADGDVQMDEATGNFPGSVASVAGAVGSVTGAVGSVTGAVASVTAGVTVTTNNDKTGYSLADPDVVADHVLRRTTANVEASANGDAVSYRSLYGAVAKLVNKIAVSGATLTVYKTDDATSLGTQAVTTDATADPITALDTV